MRGCAVGEVITKSLLRGLRQFFPQSCTILADTPTEDANGQRIANLAPLADHEDLRCRLAPVSERERQTLGPLVEAAEYIVALYGFFPGVTVAMVAQVEGTAYNITGVRSDAEGVITYLGVERVTGAG